MKNLLGLATLCLIFPLVGCSQFNAPVEEYYGEQVSVIVSEIKAPSLEQVELPEPGADIFEYLTYAVAISPEISALRQAELGATSGVSLAVSKTRPQLSASSSVGGYQDDISVGDTQTGASINVTASQLLFDGGLVNGGISIAKLQVELARVVTEGAINRLSAEAASASIAASLAVRELAAINEFKEEIKPHAAQLERMAGSGLIDRSVLDEITSQLLEIDISEKEAKSNLNLAGIDYSKFFGELPVPNNAPLFPASLFSSLQGDLVADNTSAVRESALRALLAEQQVAVARSAFMPKINAQVGSSSPMDPDESISAQAGILISYQLSDGGARVANLSVAENDLEQARRALEFTVENAGGVLSMLQERVFNIKEILKLAEKKLPLLVDQLRVAESQIQTGQADISKVFEIKMQVNELQSRIRRGQADLVRTKFELAAALGLLSN